MFVSAWSCLTFCSRTAELAINVYQAITEKLVPKQRMWRTSIADSFQNLIAQLS